jgi:VCBS repeat-containing protein
VQIITPNEAPTITSGGGGDDASVTRAENTTAVATVTATDPDAGDALTFAIVGGADAGLFTIDAHTGVLTFVTAPNFETPADANGDNVYNVTIEVSDGNGGTDSQAIEVTVADANDAPVITTPPVVATVQEDSTLPVSGTIAATDADDGDVLSWSVVGGSAVGDADYTFSMDSLNVIKNGFTIFADGFDDGTPPPSVPAGSGPPSYAVNGTYGEADGRLVIDSSGAVQTVGVGTSDPLVGQFATLLTNIDPANLAQGLRNDDDFTVAGRFDLILPDSPREAYGIRLTDRLIGGNGITPDQPGDDAIELVVRRGLGGTVIIQLRELDFAANTVTTIDTIVLAAPEGADQIELRLTHDADNVGVVEASFDYLSDGVVIATQSLAGIGHIFGTETPDFAGDDENWTRAQIVTYAPEITDSTLTGTYGTLSINQAGQWNYFVANGQANVQALAAGETVTDEFTVQVSDGAGGFDTQTITVNVTGTNDAPVITGGTVSGSVTEDAPTTSVSGTLTATDIDHADTAAWSVTAQPGQQQAGATAVQGTYGTLTVSQSGQWTYTLDSGLPATQALGPNDHPVETFTINVTDSHGAFDTQTVQVTVHGTGDNDAPAIVAADDDGSVSAGAPISSVGAGYLTAGHDLISGLGGASGFGEDLLNRNDDGSTGAIDITSVFGEQGLNFFGTNYTSFFINNNGNITFLNATGQFTPSQIAGGSDNPIIAPFWADVDTRGGDPANGGTNLVY